MKLNGVFQIIALLVLLETFGYGIHWTKLVGGLCFAALGFVFLLYKNQETLLYQPKIHPQYTTPSQNPVGFRNPMEHGMDYEDVYLNTKDGIRLHAWWVPQKTSRKSPTILFFHANALNMGFRLTNIKQLFVDVGLNVFILSYRGYGESTGQPGEEGMIIDAETAFAHLRERTDLDPKSLFVFGRSLGGAVAIALLSKLESEAEKQGVPSPIRGLILENTFTSISAMVDNLFPLLRPLKPFVLRLNWPSVDRIPKLRPPILFVSGGQDEVVPAWHMKALLGAATSSKKTTFVLFDEGKHNDTWLVGGLKYVHAIRTFIEAGDITLPPLPDDNVTTQLILAAAKASAAGGGMPNILPPSGEPSLTAAAKTLLEETKKAQ
jgi:fermentation-respiration switch protein FrsA (DUF1100 family)